MDKIYRRSTQLSGTPQRKKNEKARKRNIIINFRVSAEEKKLIDKRIELSGMQRDKFFIESCLYQTILVKGYIRTLSAIRDEMALLVEKLDMGISFEDFDPETIEAFKTILEILYAVFGKVR